MCLRFVFLLITRGAGWFRLSRREKTWKTAEILILRHQFAILQRRQPRRPKLNWADRALFAALLSVIPQARRHRLRQWLRTYGGRIRGGASGSPHRLLQDFDGPLAAGEEPARLREDR